MDDHDLDIDNYDLEDLLNLFKLDYNFKESDLKGIYRRCLKTHPDKSGLDPKYFIFYKKAYKVISEVYYFRQKRVGGSTEYTIEENESEKKLLDPIKKDKENFNEWFNDMFDKVKIRDVEHDSGYEKWFKSDDDISGENRIPFSQFGKEFYKRKKEKRALVKTDNIQDMGYGGGYSLTRDKPREYSSDIFSKLKYEDLKKVYTETVIPVTKDDLDCRPKFADLDSYKRDRDSNKTAPLTMEEARTFLAKKAETEGKNNMNRAFKLIKRDQEVEDANKKWWGYIKQLGNE